jgi:hypothetical protein
MLLSYSYLALSSIPLNYYGSLGLRKKDLSTIDGSSINLYNSLENPVDYSKSVVLTDFKNNAEVFEELKEDLTDISFVSYLKLGNSYLSYSAENEVLSSVSLESDNELTENEYFEFVLSGDNLYIRKTLNTNNNPQLSSYFDNYVDERYLFYPLSSYSAQSLSMSSSGQFQMIPSNESFRFKAILDHTNNKIVIFKEGVGFLKFENSDVHFKTISSDITNDIIFNIIDLNDVINSQSLQNSFFPQYNKFDNTFLHKYSCDLQYLIPINPNTLEGEKNTNVVALKNHSTSTGMHSMAKYENPLRKYNKVHVGDSGVDQNEVFLGFTTEYNSLHFDPDRVTYFHVPSKLGKYNRININDTNLIEGGAIGGDSPENSDKIFKKNYNYGKVTNTGNPSGLLNGQYLCSWLYYDPVNPSNSAWVDRYYSPRKFNKTDAMHLDTYNALERFYTEVGIDYFELSSYKENVRVGEFFSKDIMGDELLEFPFGIISQEVVFGAANETLSRVGVFDVRSALTFEPDCLYAYHHIGKNSSKTILEKYDSNLIVQDFDQIESFVENEEKVYNLDGESIYSKDLSYELENSEFTISFDISTENPESIVGEMLIGNFSDNTGFGLFKDFTSTPFHFTFNDNVLNVFDYNHTLQSSLALGENIFNVLITSPYSNNFIYGNGDNLYEISKGNAVINKTDVSSQQISKNTPYSMAIFGTYIYMLKNDGNSARYNMLDGEVSLYTKNKYYDSSTNSFVSSMPSGTHSLCMSDKHGGIVLLNSRKYEKNSEDQIFLFYDTDTNYLGYPKSIIEYDKNSPIVTLSDDGIVDFIINEDDELYVLTYNGKLYKVDYSSPRISASFVMTKFENCDKRLQTNNFIKNGKQFSYIEVVNSQNGKIQRYNKDLSKYVVLETPEIVGNTFDNYNSSKFLKFDTAKNSFTYRINLVNFYDSSDLLNLEIPILYRDLKQITNKITLTVNNVVGQLSLYLNGDLYYTKFLTKGKYYFNKNILDNRVYVGTTIYNNVGLDQIIEEGAYFASGFALKNFVVYDKAFSYYDILDLNRKTTNSKPATLNLPISTRNYIEEIRSWFLQNKNFRKSEYVNVNVVTNEIDNSQKNELSSYIMDELETELGLNFRINNINFFNNTSQFSEYIEPPISNSEYYAVDPLNQLDYNIPSENSIATLWTAIRGIENPLDSIPTLSSKRDNWISGLDPAIDRFPSAYLGEAAFTQYSFTDSGPYSAEADEVRAKYKFLGDPSEEWATATYEISGYWNPEFWGYPARDLLNFSGVSMGATGASDENNITLITPRHGVYNTHFGQWAVGEIAYYYDHTTGQAISAEIAAIKHIGQDCSLVKFTENIEEKGDIKVYKMLSLTNEGEIRQFMFPTVFLAGSAPFGNYKDEHCGLGCTGFMTPSVSASDGPSTYDNIRNHVSFDVLKLVNPIFENTRLGLPQGNGLQVGDSSSPMFIPYTHNGVSELFLHQTFLGVSAGTLGPNYSSPQMQEAIRLAMEVVGNPEGYDLRTVTLSAY